MESLSSHRAVAIVNPDDGGRLVSLVLDGIELLGSGDVADGLPAGWFHGLFPMAPYAGRTKDGRFQFDGATYTVPLNAGSHAGHGLVFDVPWSVRAATNTELALATELDDRWPFGGRVEETFQLSETALTMTLTILNNERRMPAALGFHPWFRRNIGTDGPASYSVKPVARFASDKDGFPRLLSQDFGDRPWDDVFQGMFEPPTISWPNGPTIRITSTGDTWIVYERQPKAFCIEPITAPPNSLGTARSAVVGPGQPLSLQMRLIWD